MSGWGESDARGEWYADKDFDVRNLRVQKGERLPDAWQRSQNVQYLKQTYGQSCVQYRSRIIDLRRQQKEEAEDWVPARKEVSGKKGK